MNNKITFPRLATLIADKSGRSKRFSEDFLREFFTLISERLEAGESVKIKGLGTFKLSKVEARKSVDVTTGEPMEISGHSKVVFLPAKELAAAVNSPFEAFTSIEISDDVDISQLYNEQNLDKQTYNEDSSDQGKSLNINIEESKEEINEEIKEDSPEAPIIAFIDVTEDESATKPDSIHATDNLNVVVAENFVGNSISENSSEIIGIEESEDIERIDESEDIERIDESEDLEEIAAPENVERIDESEDLEKIAASENINRIDESEDLEEIAASENIDRIDESEDLEEIAASEDIEEIAMPRQPEEIAETVAQEAIAERDSSSSVLQTFDEISEVQEEEATEESIQEDIDNQASEEPEATEELQEVDEKRIRRNNWKKGITVALIAAVCALFATFAIWYIFATNDFNKIFNKTASSSNLEGKGSELVVDNTQNPNLAVEPTPAVALEDTTADSASSLETEMEVPTSPSDPVVYDTISTTRYLTTMAKKYYGNYNLWPYIYEENKAKLGHPDRIRPGTPVVIPKLSKYGVDPSNPADVEKAKKMGVEIYSRYGKKI